MGPSDIPWVYIGVTAGLALLIGFVLAKIRNRAQVTADKAQHDHLLVQGQEILAQARKEAENLYKEADLRAKDELFQKRAEFSREMEQARAEMREHERRLEKREDALENQQRDVAKKERAADHSQKKNAERRDQLEKRQAELDVLVEEQTKKLHEVSGMSREQAEAILLERVERELSDEMAIRIHKNEERIRATSDQKAREIVITAIQRVAAGHTADTTVSTVDIPSDDMKGRIIGREGRNIRTFEKCTGVDVIVDDTPGVVIVSAFDNVRREIARLSLTKLIQDGRIHPTRIEEVVKETQLEVEKHVLEVGKQAALDANIGPLHDKLCQLLGRLKFRTSYSQNVLQHSMEVAHLCGMMADELRLNGLIARRSGLLHDIGKAADHEMEGGHPKIGADLAKRYGETNADVLHAIVGHHDDVTIDHVYTVLVAAADAISAARPGARRETLEKYVKRLEELEAVACGFPGVEHAYAIQAGREVRVIADAGKLNDADALRTCREIAKAIEEQMDYPGEIKVTVVRETRAVEFAR
jgi:ribonuclease Y